MFFVLHLYTHTITTATGELLRVTTTDDDVMLDTTARHNTAGSHTRADPAWSGVITALSACVVVDRTYLLIYIGPR